MTDSANGGNGSGAYDPLQVKLPIFDGPLDLLLHLIRKQSLNISDLRISELTEPYLAYLELMQELNLDQAGEFLSIAATLIWIKSKSLLPVNLRDEEQDPETVEELLVQRLQEYQKIKDAAFELGSLEMLGRDVFPRREPPDEEPTDNQGQVFGEVSIFGLLEAFRDVLARVKAYETLHIIPERLRVEDKLDEVLSLLAERKEVFFRDLFPPDSNRSEIIISFIALLELVRLHAVLVVQARTGGEILCRVTESFLESDLDWKSLVMGSLFGASGAEESDQPTS